MLNIFSHAQNKTRHLNVTAVEVFMYMSFFLN